MTTAEILRTLLLTALLLAALGGGLYFAHRQTKAYFGTQEHKEFQRQLIMLGLTVFALLLAIVMAPVGPKLKTDLLSVFGIVLSATIALSSATLIGNAMAGIMLRVIKNFRPGDYIYVGEHRGRVSEMDLLHTEIQTEERDLTTLPNLYMVNNPVRVLRRSGTILGVEVSLGYDVPRHEIEKLLTEAAAATGLVKPTLQIRGLGDFSVTYCIVGLLKDTEHLIKKRRELRARTMDALHTAGIEIASPNILSMRDYPANKAFVPDKVMPPESVGAAFETGQDELIFDKAIRAETVAKLRERIEARQEKVAEIEATLKTELSDAQRQRAEADKAALINQIERLTAVVTERESNIEKD